MERWSTIPILPGYEASNFGRIRKILNGRIMYQNHDIYGYRIVRAYTHGVRKCFKVHRLVCAAFHGEPPTRLHQVAHADGIRDNNCPENLRWATPIENSRDRFTHGTMSLGEDHCGAKITEHQVREIRRRSGEVQQRLAEEFGISQTHVSEIIARKSWAHI